MALVFSFKKLTVVLVARGLHCCLWTFPSCGEQGLLFVAVCWPLIVAASRCKAQALGGGVSCFSRPGPSFSQHCAQLGKALFIWTFS